MALSSAPGRRVRLAGARGSSQTRPQVVAATAAPPRRHLQHGKLPLQLEGGGRYRKGLRPSASERWGGGGGGGEAAETPGWWQGSQRGGEEGSSLAQSRLSSLFGSSRDGGGDADRGSISSGSGSSIGGSGGGFPSAAAAPGGLLSGGAAPLVAAALVPTALWCFTWCFTGGMVTLANACMSGMCSLAMLLHPTLPVRGAGYEDVAVSLAKALHSQTDGPSTWSRPGLWVPGWLLRALMGSMFHLATASSNIAASLIPVKPWLLASSVSQGLMYAACLLLMLPLGAGLRGLAQQLQELLQRQRVELPSFSLPFALPRLTDDAALSLKLAGVIAWPCISAAAVLQPLAASQGTFTANLAVAAPQVAVTLLLLALLLALGATAGRYAFELAAGRGAGGAEGAADFGLQVGALCAAQAALNAVQIALCVASGQLAGRDLVFPLASTLVLCRIVWSVWRLHRLGAAAAPSVWLQLLTLAPDPRLPARS